MGFVQVSAGVQSTSASSIAPSLTGVTAGNSLIYAAAHWNSNFQTDNIIVPASYTEDIETARNSDGADGALGSRHNVASGTHAPSITFAASSWVRAVLIEVSGIQARETQNSNSATGTTNATSGSVTPGASTSIMYAFITHAQSPATFTPTGSWVQRFENEDTDAGQPINVIELTGVTGSQTGTWTLSSIRPYVAGIVSYPAAAAAAGHPASRRIGGVRHGGRARGSSGISTF